MRQSIISAFALLMVLISTSGSWGQANYRPGQTFNSAAPQQPTPAPVNITPIPTVTAPRLATPKPVAPKKTSLYNISEKDVKAAGQKNTKPANSKPVESDSQEKKSSIKETVTSSNNAADRQEPIATPTPAVKTENAITPAVTPEPVNKIVISSRKTGKKLVALTYDDGPNPAYTPKLAEYLKANAIPATFFLCGNMVKEHPATVKMLADMGFELANHSYDHPQLTKLSREGIREQLQNTHDLIKEAAGTDVKLMRPPYGAQNGTVREVCEQLGYKVILWDVDTEDWRKRPTDLIVSTIMKQTGDGSIILMHDRKHGGMDTVLDATRKSVEQLRAKGYRFVTVGELLSDSDSGAVKLTDVSTSAPAASSQIPIPAAAITPVGTVKAITTDSILPSPPVAQPVRSY